MNINDFSLLTPEEIKETVAEVLQERGIERILEKDEDDEYLEKDGPKSKRGKAAAAATQRLSQAGVSTDTLAKARVANPDADQKRKADAEIDALTGDDKANAPGQPSNVVQAAGADPNPGKTPAGLNDRGDAGIGAGLAAAAEKGSIAGAGQDPSTVQDPSRWSLEDAWFEPATSNVPAQQRAMIKQYAAALGAMSPEQVIDYYIKAGKTGGLNTMSLTSDRRYRGHLATMDGLIKKAQSTKDPQDIMSVLRTMDSFLAMAIQKNINSGITSVKRGDEIVNVGKDGKDGKDGAPGRDGRDGRDAETPPGPPETPEPPEVEDDENKGADIPVPVNKKLSGQQRDKAGLSGGAAGSLASQLAKLFPDVDKSIITQILKDVAGQLKANNIPVQEGKRLALRILLEHQVKSMVLLEKKPSRAQRKARSAKMRQKKDSGKWSVQKLSAGEFVGQRPSGEQKKFHQLKYQDKYGAKALQKAKEEATCWAKTGEACPEEVDNTLFDKFKETLKRLDLHTSEGRAAAKNDEQAYLGAFRYLRAMQAAFKAIKGDKLEQATDKLMKMVEPLNEKFGENEHAAGKDFRTWLGNMINIFKEEGFDDRERGMAAMKAARKGRMPGSDSKDRSAIDSSAGEDTAGQALDRVLNDPKATKAEKEKARQAHKQDVANATAQGAGKLVGGGTINTKAVVGPRLKQGGIDLKSPEGQKLQKQMQKVIRRFVKKNLDRIGKGDLKVIAENNQLRDELVSVIKEHLGQK